MDTLLYDFSIPAISSLQSHLSEQASFMQLMSVVFDPKYAFLIYSPIAYLLDQKVGRKLIMTTVIAEWLNQILKWLLHGERPYWYVHSSGHFVPQQTPIQQFPITCELGPGHPSGHAMVTAAVWYIILDSLLQHYSDHILSAGDSNSASDTSQSESHASNKNQLRRASIVVWALYTLLLVTVSVSRVFLGCHFPHQCLAGALLGLVLAKTVSSLDNGSGHFIAASFFMFVTAFGAFGLLQALGFDPSWTIKLATTHCVKREYIHMDTAPFFSIMRYCGFALGTGLALLISPKNVAQQLVPEGGRRILVASGNPKESSDLLSSRNVSWFSIKIFMALVMARLVDNLGMFVSHANPTFFYSSAYLAYTLFSFAFINL